ncbi:MAG: hypothetical protein L0Y43_01230 [Methylococcaceae bacterium]|nr:hypothetical protein [Methylococcaceae bacterium]
MRVPVERQIWLWTLINWLLADRDQKQSAPQQVSDRPLRLRINVSGRQDPEPQQMRQPKRIMPIVAVFQAIVLFDRSRVDQFDHNPGFLQAIDQPVPVERRFHRNPLQGFTERNQRFQG